MNTLLSLGFSFCRLLVRGTTLKMLWNAFMLSAPFGFEPISWAAACGISLIFMLLTSNDSANLSLISLKEEYRTNEFQLYMKIPGGFVFILEVFGFIIAWIFMKLVFLFC